MPRGPAVRIVEVTVRDGGYEVDHNWGLEDVATLVSLLDGAGFGYVEVGHGMGVGRQSYPRRSQPQPPAALTDEQQMRAARSAADRTRVGVVCVPGPHFMPIDEVDRIAALEMDFLRFAVMPDDVGPTTLPYLERAKSLGMTVSLNLMQTYARTPVEVARIAADARRCGADWFYVVDSAGGMHPGDVREYVTAILGETDLEVGLHAHNNSGLAVANCLAAVEVGATLVDTSLNGLGRATGNPPTEQVLLALQAMDMESDVDLDAVSRAGHMARALLAGKGSDPLDYVSGTALIHSRNVPGLRREAEERGLSSSQFVVAVGGVARERGELGRLEFPAELLDTAAARCRPARGGEPAPALVDFLRARIDAADSGSLPRTLHDLSVRAAKYHKRSALHVVPAELLPFRGALPWESDELVGITVGSAPAPASCPEPDIVFADPAAAAGALPAKLRLAAPAWRAVWLEATATTAAACAARSGGALWLPEDPSGDDAAIVDLLRGLGVALAGDRPAQPAALLVIGPCTRVPELRPGDSVVVAARASEARAWAAAARARGAVAVMPAVAHVLAARMQAILRVSAAVAGALEADVATDGLVELPRAPAPGQAIVDLDTAAVVDDDASDDLADRLARHRARLLVAGTRRL